MLLVFVLFNFSSSFCYVAYNQTGYLDIVNLCGRILMMKAIAEVKALPKYRSDGEVFFIFNFSPQCLVIVLCMYSG